MEISEAVKSSVGYSAHRVHPWNHITVWLHDNIDGQDIDNVLALYNFELYSELNDDLQWRQNISPEEMNRAKQHIFFAVIETYPDKWQSGMKLLQVLECLKLHTDRGTSFVDVLDQYLQELSTYLQQCEVIANDAFVGRESDLKTLVDMLEDMVSDSKKERGINICGIGGQGKSTLAQHICHDLESASTPWTVCRIDLRNKRSTSDIVNCLLTALNVPTQQLKLDHLIRLLKNFCSWCKDKNTLLCLDDCDAVLKADQSAFLRFLNNILSYVHGTRDCKVVFLLTARQRMAVLSQDQCKHLHDHDLNVLSGEAAVSLLKRSSGMDDIADGVCDEIVEECAWSPLAVTIVAGLIRNDTYTPDKVLFHLKQDKKNVTKALQVDKCIEESFKTLDDRLKETLVRLSVFQSAEFDKVSAASVLKRADPGENVVLSESLQRLHNLHLLEVRDEARQKVGKSAKASQKVGKSAKPEQFSLHPLVYRYIAEVQLEPFRQAYYSSVDNFVKLYERKIMKIVHLLDTNCTKGMRVLDEQKVHVRRFYDYLHDEPDKLQIYSRQTKSNDIRIKKYVSDLTVLFLSNLKKRRLFASEAARANRAKNDTMTVFWQVEEANVLLTLDDKPGNALEQLDRLSAGRFAGLRGFHDEPVYTPLVHALFHKVKGQAKWKLGHDQEALEHLQLSLTFYNQCSPKKLYCNLNARALMCVGLVYLDMGDCGKAEQWMQTAYNDVLGNMKHKDSKLQWDIPAYLGHFGTIELKKAEQENVDNKVQHLNKALDHLNEGMKVARSLNLDRTDNYCCMLKTRADVYVAHGGQLNEALHDAERAMDLRSVIIQLPNYNVTDSTYQVAKVYMLLGDENEKVDLEKTQMYWDCARGHFCILENDHLIDGSIRTDQPLFAMIQRDHFGIYKRLQDENYLKKLRKFYKDIHEGAYEHNVRSVNRDFMAIKQTPQELIQQMFKGGGSTFGEDVAVFQVVHDDEEMEAGAGRRDSGVGHSSTEGVDSQSSDGGSVSEQMRQLQLQKSLSLDDNVFQEPPSAKKSFKRQRTHESKTDT